MGRLGCPCGNVLHLSGGGDRDFTFYSDATAMEVAGGTRPTIDTLDAADDGEFHECAECGRLLFFPKGRVVALVYAPEGHAERIGGK